jgi:hypothetical protein
LCGLGWLIKLLTGKDTGTVSALPEDESSPFDPPALPDTWQLVPVCWATLDRATAAHQWAALADWVRWLATRYALATRTIPPCWYRHGGIVEEVSALRTGWLAAYAPDAQLSAALDWHHMFDGTRSRLHETTRGNGCTKDDHRDDDTARWLTIPDPGFAAACEADLANRAPDPAT